MEPVAFVFCVVGSRLWRRLAEGPVVGIIVPKLDQGTVRRHQREPSALEDVITTTNY